jgi:DNA polymerase (family 10)
MDKRTIGNAQIAAVFEEIADLLEVQGENPFRIRAYRNAARTVGQQGPAFAGRGAGRTDPACSASAPISSKIHEIARTGSCELLRTLRREVPRGTAALLHVPGLGPKRVQALVEQLGVHAPGELLKAVKSGRVRELPGFGARTEQRLLEALGAGRSKSQRFPLAVARSEAEPLLAYLREAPGIREAIAAGSLRRERATVGDIDLLVVSEAGTPVTRRFVEYLRCETCWRRTHPRQRRWWRYRSISGSCRRAAMGPRCSTSPDRSNSMNCANAPSHAGLKLNEYGLFRGSEQIAGDTEASIYQALGTSCPADAAKFPRPQEAEMMKINQARFPRRGYRRCICAKAKTYPRRCGSQKCRRARRVSR